MQVHTSWKLPISARDSFGLDSLWSNTSRHAEWLTIYISVTRRQLPEIQLEPLLGSGTHGAIRHDSKATSLRRTSKQDGTQSH